MHQALYRKYRPRRFDDVWGEDQVTSVLRYEAMHGKASHAYLFCGPRGTGKTTCAKILAKVLNCENPVDGNPCGKCFACTSIDEGNAADVLEMDAASNTGVDYIRDIRDEVNYTPAALKKRVYIIDEVHMLSIGAFNALLKTLEEPPEHVVFILATTEFHKLPATIVSRCQRFDFRRIKTDILAERLLYIAEQESISLEEAAAKTLAKQAQGGMRDAISLFELCAAGGHEVTSERVAELLGLTGIEMLYKTAVAVARNDASGIFRIMKTVDSSSRDLSVFWNELLSFWRSLLVFRHLPEEERNDYLELTEPELRLLGDAARRFRPETLRYHFGLMDAALKDMARLPQNKRLTAELTLLKMADPALDTSAEALLARIAALEEKIGLLEAQAVLPRSAPAAEDGSAEDESTGIPFPQTSEPSMETAAPTVPPAPTASPEPTPAPQRKPVSELGDVIERLRTQNPLCSAFLGECDCFVTEDKSEVLIVTANAFTKDRLADSLPSLQAAFRMCGVTEPGATISFEIGTVEKKKPAIDELSLDGL